MNSVYIKSAPCFLHNARKGGSLTSSIGASSNGNQLEFLKDEPNDIKNCYSVHGEARYGPLAYKHVVIVTNRCELSLACEVWTDVDPTPKQSLTVEPKGTGEVIVRTSSPARAFKAFGECKKQ